MAAVSEQKSPAFALATARQGGQGSDVRGQKTGDRRQETGDSRSLVGAAFSRDLNGLNGLTNRLIKKGEWPSCLPISP